MQHLAAVGALWRREIIKMVRDRSRLIGAVAQPLGFWVLLGLGFSAAFRMPGAEGLGYFEFLFPGIITLILLFTAIFSTIYIVEDRKSGFLQAGLVAPVPRPVIVFGNVLGGTTLALGQAILFLFLAPAVGIIPSVTGLLIILLGGFLTALAFTALGFIIAWRMESTRGFHAVMNLFLLPMWILSGGFFPVEGTHAVLKWIVTLNPVTYGVATIRHGLYWPEAAPGAEWGVLLSILVIAAFAALMIMVAVLTVRRPLYS